MTPPTTTAQRRRLIDDPTGLPGVGVRPTWEPWAFLVLAVFSIVFGVIVVDRSTFSDRRRTDAGVFFRAGWAVQEGVQPYGVTDENDWFFLYPPGVAAMFVPLADPPAGEPLPAPKTWFQREWKQRAWDKPHYVAGYLPYEVSVAIWYAIGVLCIGFSGHWLARALQEGSPDPAIRGLSPSHGGWWNIRFWPLLMVLPDFCSALSRGQINMLLLAPICLGVLLWVRNRRVLAGFCWAFAAFLKVFPGVLVCYPLMRKDVKMMWGYAICFVLTMILLPLVVFGPERAIEYTQIFADRVLLAGLGLSDQSSLQAGTGFDNTDNHAVQGALHNLINIATPRGQRPIAPEAWVKLAHYAVFIVMLSVTILIGRRGRHEATREDSALELLLRVGMFCSIMLAAVPMCHRHYFMFLFPGVFALVWMNIMTSRMGFLKGAALVLVPLYAILLSLPRVSQQGVLRDLPIPMVINLVVFVMCCARVRELARTRGVLQI